MITLILSRHGTRGTQSGRTGTEDGQHLTFFASFWAMNNCTGYRADVIIVQDEPTDQELRMLRQYHFHRASLKTLWINHLGQVVPFEYYMN